MSQERRGWPSPCPAAAAEGQGAQLDPLDPAAPRQEMDITGAPRVGMDGFHRRSRLPEQAPAKVTKGTLRPSL